MLRTPLVHTDFFPLCSPAFLKTIRPVRVVHLLASSSSCRPSAKSSACSLIGSLLCDFTLIRNMALPAVIRILHEHSTSRMMSAFGAVANVVLPPSPIHPFTSIRTDSLSQRYRMSSVSSTCCRAASSAASSGRFELVPSCSLPTRMHPATSLRCRQQNPAPIRPASFDPSPPSTTPWKLYTPNMPASVPIQKSCSKPFSATLHSSFLASLHMASSISCLCPSLPALAWTQHDIDHGLGLALTSPRFHHPFHLHELPPFLSRVLSSPASVVAFPLTSCPTRTLPYFSKSLCPLASRFGKDVLAKTTQSVRCFMTSIHCCRPCSSRASHKNIVGSFCHPRLSPQKFVAPLPACLKKGDAVTADSPCTHTAPWMLCNAFSSLHVGELYPFDSSFSCIVTSS